MKITYYKLVDPINGAVTKTYGFEVERSAANSKITLDKEGVATVHRHEVKTHTVKKAPQGEGVEEITKEEFDALDTSKESIYSQYRREARSLQLARRAKIQVREIPATIHQLEEALNKAHSKRG